MKQLTIEQAFRKLKKTFPKRSFCVTQDNWRHQHLFGESTEETMWQVSIFPEVETPDMVTGGCKQYRGGTPAELVKRVIEEEK